MKARLVTCEWCHAEVTGNRYVKNHGDNCAYKDVALGYKRCSICKEELPLFEYAASPLRTHDGLYSACRVCSTIRRVVCPECGAVVTLERQKPRAIKKVDVIQED